MPNYYYRFEDLPGTTHCELHRLRADVKAYREFYQMPQGELKRYGWNDPLECVKCAAMSKLLYITRYVNVSVLSLDGWVFEVNGVEMSLFEMIHDWRISSNWKIWGAVMRLPVGCSLVRISQTIKRIS